MPIHKQNHHQAPSIAEIAEAKRLANGVYRENEKQSKQPPAPGQLKTEFGATVRKFDERQSKAMKVSDEAVEKMETSDKAHLRVVDYDRMKELYEQGMSDGKIARELGLVDQSLVHKWRERYSIPAHGNQKRKPKFDSVLAREMYDQGNNDQKIADHFGVDRSQVYQWRKKEGLEAKAGRRTKVNLIPILDMIPTPEQLDVSSFQQVSKAPDASTKADMEVPTKTSSASETIFEAVKKTHDKLVELFPPLPIEIPEPDPDEWLSEIELLKEQRTDLLIKNADLAGYARGVQDTLILMRGK